MRLRLLPAVWLSLALVVPAGSALAAEPDRAERETVRKLLTRSPSRKEGFEDLLWTLLNTAESTHNH